MTFGSKYNEDHNIPFPPFSQFIRKEAKARNDLSFNVSVSMVTA